MKFSNTKILFFAAMFVMISAVSVNAQTSGSCGSNLTWNLDNGTLTISGTGAMTNYSSGSAPWYSNRSSITAVTIPEGVTSLGNYAFHGCSNLTTVNFNATNCTSFGYSGGSISSYAFYNLTSITALNIGANVTNIPQAAFYGCSGIASIDIPNSVTGLGNSAFYGCSGATNLSIGIGITSIPSEAFSGCSSIPSVTISERVTSLGSYAFHGCSNLTTVNFNATNCTSFGYSGGSISSYAFYNLTSITALNIGANVTNIPQAAFYGCSGIASIDIPNSVTGLGNSAFYGCSGATNLSIGTGITSIPSEAFYGCSGIPSVTISEGVTTINDYAFANCTGLQFVRNLRTTPQTISSYTFNGVTVGNVDLLVPQASIAAYQAANYWKNFNISSVTYNVTFYKRNGTANTTQAVIAFSSVPEPEKPTHPSGDYFYGWYTDSILWSASSKWNFSTNTVSGNTNLYARWVPQTMLSVVTYNSDNGTALVKDTILSGETTTAAFTPTKTGYIFAGWYNNTTLFDFNTAITTDITLTAHWTAQNYDILYILNGGVNNTNNPASYTIESAAIALQDPTRTGCTFAGWAEGNTIPTGSTGNKTFTAQWNLISYDITYNLDGGTNNPANPATYTVEDDIMLQNPTKASYGFTGWLEGNSIPSGSTGNKTFTAQWVLNSVSAVQTIAASNVTDNSAVLGGDIRGTGTVICGVVYSSSQSIPDLTTANTARKDNAAPAMGIFTVNATDLTANMSYYTRAWAVNEQDTVYGEVKFFTTRSNNSCYQIEKLDFTQSLPSFVDILVRVRDCYGKGANYLENSDFQVWEDDELTKSSETHSYIRKMDAMPFVIKTTLVLDVTSSLNVGGINGIEAVKTAAVRLVEQKEENQEISVIVFNRTIPDLIQNFTTDKATIISAINSIDSEMPGNTTRLYDAYKLGLNNLPVDSVTASYIRKSFMVVFTDGNDVSVGQSNAEQQLNDAIAARQAGGQQVYVIGLGNVDASILQQLASTTNDYKPISNLSQLESMFVQVQSEIMREANSFYLLNYLSPKRGDMHDLKLKIIGNSNSGPNAYAQQTFDAANFVSAQYGVYVNPYTTISGSTTGMYGINTETYTLNSSDTLKSVTYWSDVVPQYEWTSSNPNIVKVETVDYNKVKLGLTGSGSAVLTLKDVSNYNHVNSGDNATIAPYGASAFQRSFTVNSTGTTATITLAGSTVYAVNFDADGGIPAPETQYVGSGGKVQQPSISPVKAGFEFLGWYQDVTQYNFNNTVMSNLNLSARWLAVSQIESTFAASGIKKDSVTISGSMEYNGQPFYTERGICYAITLDPTVVNTKKVISGTENGFSIRFGGLTANTTYFVRPYAINATDTVYGKHIVFTTRQVTERYSLTGYPPVATKKPSFVEVLVSVKDNNGKGADYLEDSDFILKQNNIPTSDASEFHRYINKMDAIPFTIKTVLMLDNSSSLGYEGFEQMKQAAVELIKNKHEKQYYAVYSFSDNAVIVQDFSNSVDTLVQQISRIKLGSSTTDLYNSYITGINHLPVEYSNKDSIQKCFFVMLSDGDETQHQYTTALANTAISARGAKTAYMIGLGQDLNTARLTALASNSANYYSATSVNQVKGIFANIQNDIMREANSFYNLVCLTDKRDFDGEISLQLTINNNENTAADMSYSTAFTSIGNADDDVYQGVYLNVYENIPNISIGTTNKYGIGMPDNVTSAILRDTLGTFSLSDGFILKAVTYWADVKPNYVWTSSNPAVAIVEKIDFDRAILKFSGNSTDSVIISVKDVANYDLVASGNGQGIPASTCDFFIRSIGVKGIIKQAQTITWNQTFENVTYGDVITLNATASSNLPVSYSSSNSSIATVSGNALSITGIGTVTVTANQNGNTSYHTATGIEKTINAAKAVLNVSANSKNREYGFANPQLTYTISGFKNNETQSVINVLPTISTDATVTSDAGTDEITVQNASDDHYDFTYQNGTLTINKAPLTITANNAERAIGEPNPQFTLSYSAFRNNETEQVLDELPNISCAANETSPAGFYDIVLSGGNDNNYTCTLVNGRLEVKTGGGIDDIVANQISIFPNPVKGELFIKSDLAIEKVEIYTLTGALLVAENNLRIRYPCRQYPQAFICLKYIPIKVWQLIRL